MFYMSVSKSIHIERCKKLTLEELMRVQQQYIDELSWFVFSPWVKLILGSKVMEFCSKQIFINVLH